MKKATKTRIINLIKAGYESTVLSEGYVSPDIEKALKLLEKQ